MGKMGSCSLLCSVMLLFSYESESRFGKILCVINNIASDAYKKTQPLHLNQASALISNQSLKTHSAWNWILTCRLESSNSAHNYLHVFNPQLLETG